MDLPHPEIRRALVTAYASVLESLGLATRPRSPVLPNGQFFPDVFTGDEASVQRMLDRLLEHAGLSDMAVVVQFWDDADGACGTGACGSCGPTTPEPALQRLVDDGDTWRINVVPAEVRQPVALSCALCRGLALAVLREADAPPRHLDLDLAVDLTGVALGFGVLLLEGSHIYRKACSGPAISQSTALGPNELAFVLALELSAQGRSARGLNQHLSPTQRQALDEARFWASSNVALTQALRSDPRRIARGELELREPVSWLGRWFGGQRTPHDATIDELEAALTSPVSLRALPPASKSDPQFDEIKRLVDEALSE